MAKWKGTIVAGVLMGATIFGSLSAWAGPHGSYVDQRQRDQEQRIQQALQSGQLSPGEYWHLENQQQQIRMVENQMRADGRLNPGEKNWLNDMLNHSERDINRFTHHNGRPGWH